VTRLKKLIDKLAPSPKNLADACGESKETVETTPDVARRRDLFNKKHESCCGALDRDEPCTRPPARQCDEATTGEE